MPLTRVKGVPMRCEQGSREARQGVAAPKAESPAHLSAATNPTLSDNSHLRLLLDDAENSTENKGRWCKAPNM